jgi:hypothetical protein
MTSPHEFRETCADLERRELELRLADAEHEAEVARRAAASERAMRMTPEEQYDDAMAELAGDGWQMTPQERLDLENERRNA